MAFSAHLVPGVEDLQVHFGLSRDGPPKLIVHWAKQSALETYLQVIKLGCSEGISEAMAEIKGK